MSEQEEASTEASNKIAPGSVIKVASLSIGEKDVLWVTRHYNGLGTVIKYFVVYVIRDQKLLGMFNSDGSWSPSPEHKNPASESEILNFISVRTTVMNMLDKVWK